MHDNNMVQVRFSETGVACIAERYEDIYPTGVSELPDVTTYNGKDVPFFGSWSRNTQGYGVVGAQIKRISYGPKGESEQLFEVYWVGEMSALTEIIVSQQYTTVQAVFF